MRDTLLASNVEILQSKVDNLSGRVEHLENALEMLRKQMLVPGHVCAFTEKDNIVFLMNLDDWPKAIPEHLICNNESEEDKLERAENILDLYLESPIENLKFLDFGCGTGHSIVKSLRHRPKLSVGYDITESGDWNKHKLTENAILTTDWGKVVSNGPYDVVLVYDVLDHVEPIIGRNTFIETLKTIKSITTPGKTRVYVRCHPWCSRHGAHTHNHLNKAYAHLVLNDLEMQEMGLPLWTGHRITQPLIQYESSFRHVGFRVTRLNVIQEPIEPFFVQSPVIANKIKEHWYTPKHRGRRDMPITQLNMQFIDYMLL